jgi:hypothetical protein
LRRAGWLSLTSPVTGLPSSKLIEEQLREIMRRDDWSVLYIGINHISDFNDVYGFVAGDVRGWLMHGFNAENRQSAATTWRVDTRVSTITSGDNH